MDPISAASAWILGHSVWLYNRYQPHKQKATSFERLTGRPVTEGNEKADDLAKAGATSDEGFMAEARAKAMQQEREEVYAALQYAASFHCLEEQWKDCEELRPKSREKWVFLEKER